MSINVSKTDANNKIIYLLMIAIVFFSSLRAPDTELALDYSVPAYLQVLQSYSVVLVLLLMVISIGIVLFRTTDAYTPPNGLLLSFYVFHMILLLTEYVKSANLQEFFSRAIFITITFVYFLKVVGSLVFYSENKLNGNAVIHAFFWGIFGFIGLNMLTVLAGIGTVMWKGRLFGLAAHPNFLGVCSAICVALSLVLLVQEKNWKKKLLYFFGFFIGVWVSMLTNSRTSMLSSGVACIVFFVVSMNNSAFKPFFLLLVIWAILVGTSNMTVQSLDSSERGNTREETWKQLYDQVATLPIFGRGRIGASTNAFMYAIAASGLFGAFFFFKSLFGLMGAAFRDLFDPHNFRRIAVLTILMLILVSSVFEGYLLDTLSIPSFTYWMLLAATKQLT